MDYGQLLFEYTRPDHRRRLGRGSFGFVFKAMLKLPVDTGTPVAVKEFDYEFLKVEKHQKEFYNEVNVLYNLQHPNIVKMIGASTEFVKATDDPPFIVFELLPTTLYAALHIEHKISADDHDTILRIASEICAGLVYLHSQSPRVVHHDLKPENIMLTATLRVKLIDFGLASTAATLATVSAGRTSGVGTLGYLSPEKLDSSEQSRKLWNSHKVDVYAYGVVLWQLATGELPFLGMDLDRIKELTQTGMPLPDRGATPAITALIEACRSLKPALRPDMSVVSSCLLACSQAPNAEQALHDVKQLLRERHGAPGSAGLRGPQLSVDTNGFGPPALDATRMSAHLTRPAPLSIQAGAPLIWQMAVLAGHGMRVAVGAGVGWIQLRVAITPVPSFVIIGLVLEDAYVADGQQFPGRLGVANSAGWCGNGAVHWTLPAPAPTRDTVTFGQGDQVVVVLDCRAEPIVRLLVNGRPRLVHAITQSSADTATEPHAAIKLCPAVALWGQDAADSSFEARVDLEPAPLPVGWDGPPAS